MEINNKHLAQKKLNKILKAKKKKRRKEIEAIHRITGFNPYINNNKGMGDPADKLTPKKKRRNKKGSKKASSKFYHSKEWRSLRFRVLEKHEACCMLCGRSRKDHKVVLHVDHIKPRSKFPKLELVFENLQVLCEDCNLGKSNKSNIDYRPKEENYEK